MATKIRLTSRQKENIRDLLSVGTFEKISVVDIEGWHEVIGYRKVDKEKGERALSFIVIARPKDLEKAQLLCDAANEFVERVSDAGMEEQ